MKAHIKKYLKENNYASLEAWATEILLPQESAEMQLDFKEGGQGYCEDYILECLEGYLKIDKLVSALKKKEEEKDTYEVVYSEVYKWASVIETYHVEASSEEEARQIVDEGGGEWMTQSIEHLDNHKSSDFLNARAL